MMLREREREREVRYFQQAVLILGNKGNYTVLDSRKSDLAASICKLWSKTPARRNVEVLKRLLNTYAGGCETIKKFILRRLWNILSTLYQFRNTYFGGCKKFRNAYCKGCETV